MDARDIRLLGSRLIACGLQGRPPTRPDLEAVVRGMRAFEWLADLGCGSDLHPLRRRSCRVDELVERIQRRLRGEPVPITGRDLGRVGERLQLLAVAIVTADHRHDICHLRARFPPGGIARLTGRCTCSYEKAWEAVQALPAPMDFNAVIRD